MRDAGGTWTDAGIRLTGFGHYFPEMVLHNTGDEDVRTNPVEDKVLGTLGVRSRHRAADDETAMDMGLHAARAAVEHAGIDPGELDLVIASHWTDRTWRDDCGALIASGLGAKHVNAFEVAGACAGFIHAMHTAATFLASPVGHRKALVVATERFTRRVRPGSKGELVVSDGAGAVVLEAGADNGPGLVDSVMYSNGDLAHMSAAYPPNGWVRSDPSLNEVAVEHVSAVTRELLTRNNITINDLDWVVPHSGTVPFSEGVVRELGGDKSKVVTNLAHRGNVSSASIPTTLSEFYRQGKFKRGDLVLSASIGGGIWCWGGLLYRL